MPNAPQLLDLYLYKSELVTMKTNLKTLKFGSDRAGGGSSGLPYEQFMIPGSGATQTQLQYYINNSLSLDFPIRGSLTSWQTGGPMYTLSGKIDKDRIKKFFEDKPRGTAFLQKQVELQLTNPKSQTGNTVNALTGLKELFSGNLSVANLENTRIYNGGRNTLAQVLSSGTGTHIPRAGIIPIDPRAKYYMDIVGAERYSTANESESTNRLLILTKLKIKNDVAGSRSSINTINNLGISINSNFLFQYLGGPGSTYGLGSTSIRRIDRSSAASDLIHDRPDLFPNVFTLTYQQIAEKEKVRMGASRDANRSSNVWSDFRKSLDYTKMERGAITGSVWSDEDGHGFIDYKFYNYGIDRLNKSGIIPQTAQDPFATIDPLMSQKDKHYKDDLIKFGFECMSNDDPGYSTPLIFRAFLTNGISDNHSAELSGFKYSGRGETFYTYQGFQRSISFGFKIASFSKDEMQPLYQKLNYLISQVYPDYSANGYMRAPLVKVTIGDYIYRVPGFLESVNITVDNNAPWEINSIELPKVLDISVSFKPIHDILPSRSKGLNDGVSLIANTPNNYLNQSITHGQ